MAWRGDRQHQPEDYVKCQRERAVRGLATRQYRLTPKLQRDSGQCDIVVYQIYVFGCLDYQNIFLIYIWYLCGVPWLLAPKALVIKF